MLIYRLSNKLSKKIKEAPETCLPEHENPLFDWTAHIFIVCQTQYILISNTATIYSVVLPGKGIVDAQSFSLAVNKHLSDFMRHDGFGSIYDNIIAPASSSWTFSKSSNRSVIGHMNDFIMHAKLYISKMDLPLFEISTRLNDVPFLNGKYFNARKGFLAINSTGWQIH